MHSRHRILVNHSISGIADLLDLMRRARPDLVVVATHERSDTPIRFAADHFLPEPLENRKMTAQTYAGWLLQTAIDHRVGIVLPYRRRDELAAFRHDFASHGIHLATAADQETMRTLEDKPRLLNKIASLGFAITPFREFEGHDAYLALRGEADVFPRHVGALCAKPTSGIYGAGFRIIRDDDQLIGQALSDLSVFDLSDTAFRALLRACTRSQPMMLMPFFEGSERSVDFACHDGKLLGTVSRIKKGTYQHLVHDPYLEHVCQTVARIFNLSGILNLQTIEDNQGIQRLLEVNTRPSGGIGMTALTTVNLAAAYLQALDGEIKDTPLRVNGEIRAGRHEVFWPFRH